MSAERPEEVPRAAARRWALPRGESSIAVLGAALAAILLCAVVASGWWAVHTQRQTARELQTSRINAVSTMLRDTAEGLLLKDELSSLRRVVSESAHQNNFTQCKIVLADGAVLADSEVANITAEKLPPQWPQGKAAVAERRTAGQHTATVHLPIEVANRGTAELIVSAPVDLAAAQAWETQGGVGLIGAVALAAMLVVYRFGRNQMRAMGAIREALLAIDRGETAPEVLTLSEELGAEAAAWNGILTQTSKLRHAALCETAMQSLGERRRASSALDEAFDVMSQGLLLLDEHMRIKYANGAAAVFLQMDRQQLIGEDACEVIPEPKAAKALREWVAGEVRRRVSFETERAEGGSAESHGGVLRWNIRPMRKDDTAAVMIVVDDITQQRVAEEAQHQFVAQATHELRTPLTNIRLYVETALDEGDENAALRSKCLNVINSETRRLERIVNDLLSTAEIEAGSLQVQRDDVHLDEMFSELQHDYEAQAGEKKMTLMFNLPPKLPTIQADRDKITLALHNLIGNALKYTPEGGSVSINVDVDHRKLTVEVIDTGLGISEDDQQRIFEKFYRAKDRRIADITGSGLGLALARDVVRLHGGDITVQSQVDKGSTFTLSLPVAGAA